MSTPSSLRPALAICGRNVRVHREAQKLSRKELAIKAGTDDKMVDLIESGQIDAEFGVCLEIMGALEIPPNVFFAGVAELSDSPSLLGIDAQTIDDIENGYAHPTLGMVIALVRAMGVDPAELCKGMSVE